MYRFYSRTCSSLCMWSDWFDLTQFLFNTTVSKTSKCCSNGQKNWMKRAKKTVKCHYHVWKLAVTNCWIQKSMKGDARFLQIYFSQCVATYIKSLQLQNWICVKLKNIEIAAAFVAWLNPIHSKKKNRTQNPPSTMK